MTSGRASRKDQYKRAVGAVEVVLEYARGLEQRLARIEEWRDQLKCNCDSCVGASVEIGRSAFCLKVDSQ